MVIDDDRGGVTIVPTAIVVSTNRIHSPRAFNDGDDDDDDDTTTDNK